MSGQDQLETVLDEALRAFSGSLPPIAPSATVKRDGPVEISKSGISATDQRAPGGLAFDPLAGGRKRGQGASATTTTGQGDGQTNYPSTPKNPFDDIAESAAQLLSQLEFGRDSSQPSSASGAPSSSGGGAPAAGCGAGEPDAILHTLQQLQESSRRPPARGVGPQASQAGLSDAELEGLAQQFGADDSPEMRGLMDAIMQQLLSKEVLYEPLREIGAKYPEWLAHNGSKITAEELGRYKRQEECIRRICRQYEDAPSDFPALMALLQEMQECGQPPDEIVQELAPSVLFGPDGLPSVPTGGTGEGGEESCVIM